ncbi:MAG: hypothetical protein JXX29_16640 [Deltaproteobacteria bacterium]|nr:hypothetical protein [Deltaproteobacteria bacterium]MBN2673313.1 hypothetical protein [Deltaproteobacteria bacterium]
MWRWVFGIIAVVLFCCVSCHNDKPAAPSPGSGDTASEEPAVDVSAAQEPSASPKVVSDVPVLAHGTHMVFGIRLPRGMMPIQASEKVKRFEGTHSIESVKRYLVEQLAGEIQISPTRFSTGYMINNAIPKSSQADLAQLDSSRKKYNIKIFEGSLGGASVDIWEAVPGERVSEAAVATGAGSTLQNLRGEKKKNDETPKVKYHTKRQREQATFRTFEKLAEGKPLTEEDYQSPFFTDM